MALSSHELRATFPYQCDLWSVVKENFSDHHILMFGRDVTRMKNYDRVKLGLSRTFQITELFWDLTLVENVVCPDIKTLQSRVADLMTHCEGSSRAGANGASAKLAYALRAAEQGSHVIIGHARHHIADLMDGRAPCTHIGVEPSGAR